MNLEAYKSEQLTDTEYKHIEDIYKKEFVKLTCALAIGISVLIFLSVASILSGKSEPQKEILRLVLFTILFSVIYAFILVKSGNRYINFKKSKYSIKRTALLNKKTVTFHDDKKNNDINYGITNFGPVSFASEEDYDEAIIGFEIILVRIMHSGRIINNAFYVKETSASLRDENDELNSEDKLAVQKAVDEITAKEIAGQTVAKRTFSIGKK